MKVYVSVAMVVKVHEILLVEEVVAVRAVEVSETASAWRSTRAGTQAKM